MLSISILGIFLVAALLIVVGVAAFALGVAFTSKRRSYVENETNDPPLVRDPSNPYAPTRIGGRPASSLSGGAIAIAILSFIGISLLTVAFAIYFLRATSTVKSAPMPPAPIPATQPVLQPQPPPTNSGDTNNPQP